MLNTLKKTDPKNLFKLILKDYSFLLSLVLLLIIARAVNPNFFTWNNISNIFVQSSMVGLIAMGMSMVISAGQIDISVGAQVAIIGGFGILVLNSTQSVLIMLVFCCVFGAGIGTVNGLLVTKGHMPAMIATLAMQSACRSVINHFGAGGPFTVDKGMYDSFRQLASGGIPLGPIKAPYLMLIFIAAVAIGGTSMAGGRGKIAGTFVGVLMFKIISNILTAADVSTFLNGAISAAIIVIAVLALIASAGTPAAPGAGAIVLFTILSGVGFVNEGALLAYSLILAINRPIEMLVTALNVVGDAVTSICVAKSEGLLDGGKYDRP